MLKSKIVLFKTENVRKKTRQKLRVDLCRLKNKKKIRRDEFSQIYQKTTKSAKINLAKINILKGYSLLINIFKRLFLKYIQIKICKI